MADNNNNTLGNISDFSILAERLAGRRTDKTTEKLNKNLENLNKNILSFAKNILPRTGLGKDIAAISANRNTFLTLGEQLKSRLFGQGERSVTSRFGSARGLLNTFGVVSKGSGGIADQLLERREARQQFIADQLKVNPQMADTDANRTTFGKKFDTQQKIQKQLNDIQTEITRLEEAGFTEKQIGRTGLFKQRDAESAKLVAADNRLYSTVRDEIADEIKAGMMEGFQAAAAEAQAEFNNMKPDDPRFEEVFEKFATPAQKAGEEEINEQELIQKAILQAQNEIADNTAAIVDALENDEPQQVEKRESMVGGWLKGILGTIGGFLLAKMTGIVGMLTAGISAVLGPVLKLLGLGGAAKVAGTAAGATAAGAGSAIAKGGSTLLDKAKGLVKFAAPKLATAGRIVGGLLLSKPALIASAIAGAGYLGYNMLSDENKERVSDTIAKFVGSDETQAKVEKNVTNDQMKIEKTSSDRLGDIVTKKSEEVEENKSKRTAETQTIISAPTTTNNSNSVVNNHIMPNPRNTEPTLGHYVTNRYRV